MKYLTLIALLFTLNASAQTTEDATGYGYVNGVRLDSLTSLYAQVSMVEVASKNKASVYFFQPAKGDTKVYNKKGEILTFTNPATALNFFDYNGWELVQFYLDRQTMLLKRKK